MFAGNGRNYWLKINYRVNCNTPAFMTFSNHFDKVEIYGKDSTGQYVRQLSEGFGTPISKKNLKVTHISYLLTCSNDEKTLFVKLKSPIITTWGGFETKEIIPYINKIKQEDSTYYFRLGIIFLAMIYSLMLLVIGKEKPQFFYFLYVLCFAAFEVVHLGTISEILPIPGYKVTLDYFALPYVLMHINLMFYAKYFLNFRALGKKFNALYIAVIVVRVLIYIAGSITQDINYYHPVIDIIMLSFAFYASIYQYKKGDASAKYLVMAFSVIYFGFFIHNLYVFGVKIPSFLSEILSVHTLSLFEIFVFSFAISKRLNILKSDRERALLELINLKDNLNKELEIKVQERTATIQAQADQISIYAEQIKQMNELLTRDNTRLKTDIEAVTQAQVLHKNLSYEDFIKYYPDTQSCLKFLHELKLTQNYQYRCLKCNCTKGYFLADKYALRCTKCGYVEPVTYNTIYYNVKFPLNKAFYLTYLVSTNQVYTLERLSEILELRKQTCLAFINKVKTSNGKRTKVKPGEEGWINLIITFKG